ncbi:MAG: hypothetical protein EHM12_11245 [Dehalococcoidia bacterium]|nr:MAG: hypothetical protein EHM12_11245 [Dehalococcoidia bacterium]
MKKEHVLKPTTVLLSEEQKRIIKHCSKKLTGICRPDKGSINHFIQYAIIKTLKTEFNIDFNKIESCYKSIVKN